MHCVRLRVELATWETEQSDHVALLLSGEGSGDECDRSRSRRLTVIAVGYLDKGDNCEIFTDIQTNQYNEIASF